jgi:hypothetical protein
MALEVRPCLSGEGALKFLEPMEPATAPTSSSYSAVIRRSLPCFYLPLSHLREQNALDVSGFENHASFVGPFRVCEGQVEGTAVEFDGAQLLAPPLLTHA